MTLEKVVVGMQQRLSKGDYVIIKDEDDVLGLSAGDLAKAHMVVKSERYYVTLNIPDRYSGNRRFRRHWVKKINKNMMNTMKEVLGHGLESGDEGGSVREDNVSHEQH